MLWTINQLQQIQMFSSIQTFYHSSSPQRILDKQIKPIVQHLKYFNINSLHQLKNKLQQISVDQGLSNLNKTLPVFSHPLITTQPRSSKDQKHGVSRSFLQTKRNSFTLSPKNYEDPREKERVYIISQSSKVKKHLVDAINLQQMKSALFKKRKTLNRFEQFCQNVKAKDRSLIDKRKQKSGINARSSLHSQQKTDNNPNDIFRITTRRKFWRQNRTIQLGEEPSSQMLNIRRIGKTIEK